MKYRTRKAYEVVREIGMRSISIGYKARLMSKRRANKVCRFLQARGHDVRIRYFGVIKVAGAISRFD